LEFVLHNVLDIEVYDLRPADYITTTTATTTTTTTHCRPTAPTSQLHSPPLPGGWFI